MARLLLERYGGVVDGHHNQPSDHIHIYKLDQWSIIVHRDFVAVAFSGELLHKAPHRSWSDPELLPWLDEKLL